MSGNKIPETTQVQVRWQSQGLCEYCHAAEQWQYVRFTVDHVVPLSKGGVDSLDNLALACFHCNRRKSDHLVGIDPESGIEVPLFNPRRDRWSNHFIWSVDGLLIVGLTATGRATIAELSLNRERVIQIRAADKKVGRHPPGNDQIQPM
jgi:HNH endonuclease